MADIEYYYSAHSAFAYLGSARLKEISRLAGRRIIHKPVSLGEVVAAVNAGGFGGRSEAHRAYYFGREIERWAEHREVAFKGGIPANHRNDVTLANSILIAGVALGFNVDLLAHSMMEAHWRFHADLVDKAVLMDLVDSAGLFPDQLLQTATTAEVEKVYQSNTREAIERSVFGSPTYIVDGDMFYGQDHLELVERAMRQAYASKWPES